MKKKIEIHKCMICDHKIKSHDKEYDLISGGEVKIIFGYPSIHDTEEWKGYICDDCASTLKNTTKKNYL